MGKFLEHTISKIIVHSLARVADKYFNTQFSFVVNRLVAKRY